MKLLGDFWGLQKFAIQNVFIVQTKVINIMLNVTKIRHSDQKLLEYFSMLMENQFQT